MGRTSQAEIHGPNLAICNLCHHRTCFVHRTPWHEKLTCDDYDRLQRDPANFRTRAELEREAEQAQLEGDRQEAERIDREQREARELRRIALERRAQEQQNEATINKTTKPCPKCASNIEKKGGWYVLPCSPPSDQHADLCSAHMLCKFTFLSNSVDKKGSAVSLYEIHSDGPEARLHAD